MDLQRESNCSFCEEIRRHDIMREVCFKRIRSKKLDLQFERILASKKKSNLKPDMKRYNYRPWRSTGRKKSMGKEEITYLDDNIDALRRWHQIKLCPKCQSGMIPIIQGSPQPAVQVPMVEATITATVTKTAKTPKVQEKKPIEVPKIGGRSLSSFLPCKPCKQDKVNTLNKVALVH